MPGTTFRHNTTASTHVASGGSVGRVELILVICRLAPTHIDSNEPPAHLVAMATPPLSGQIVHIMRKSGDLHHRTAVYFNVAQNGIPTGCDVCGLGVSANFPAIPSPQSTGAGGRVADRCGCCRL